MTSCIMPPAACVEGRSAIIPSHFAAARQSLGRLLAGDSPTTSNGSHSPFAVAFDDPTPGSSTRGSGAVTQEGRRRKISWAVTGINEGLDEEAGLDPQPRPRSRNPGPHRLKAGKTPQRGESPSSCPPRALQCEVFKLSRASFRVGSDPDIRQLGKWFSLRIWLSKADVGT
jgi:hypothetical protein